MTTPQSLAYIPVDLPFVKVTDRIFDYVDPRVDIDSGGHYQHKYQEMFWNSYSVRHHQPSVDNKQMSYRARFLRDNWFWDKAFASDFPELIVFLEKELPFQSITYCNLHQNTEFVLPHYDDYQDSNEVPGIDDFRYQLDRTHNCCVYRVLLRGDSQPGIFISPSDDMQLAEKIRLPSSSNTFAYAQKYYKHGAYHKTDQQKVLLQIFGILDPEENNRLIEKSYARYKEYSIVY